MRLYLKFIIGPLLLSFTCALLYVAFQWRSTEFAAYRWLAGALFLGTVTLHLTGLTLLWRRARARTTYLRATQVGAALTAAALLIFAGKELHFQWVRYSVLNADAASLARLGRHFVVGFRSEGFVDELIARNAIAGLFITAHNVRGQSVSEVRGTLEQWQKVRRLQDQRPLWIATDQEGGPVSRMTPPLPAQPSLGEVVRQHDVAGGRLEAAIRAYGRTQGTALAELGINLNFAPVVDINHNIINQEDRYTRIYQRAISADPRMVERVAGWYCDALYKSGVRCTLKHFPGLGQVQTDTHLDSAKLTLSTEALDKSDWLPFKTHMQPGQPPFTMLSHVQLEAVDAVRPVSISKRVVDDLLRKEWGYDGILITDDCSMAAISEGEGGIGVATLNALNAGVDLILISYDPDLYYPAMHALLEAERAGKLDPAMLERSRARLDALALP